ncbi:MAG: plasmid mobilization relaxosome protein MobC [Cyclobacteriaceae bacterium]|nr:plasmid mobilization relaxosome protein MobC [Cyclobacteriaceae bacterium]
MESENKSIDTNRNYRITIRFNKSEFELIRGFATTTGKSKVSFLRECALQAYIKPRLTPDEILFMRQLVGMANNLNQLARSANAKEEITLEAKALLFQLNWIIEKLK